MYTPVPAPHNTAGLAIMAFAALLLILAIYYAARPGTHNLATMKSDTERGCLLSMFGLGLLAIGGIITLL